MKKLFLLLALAFFGMAEVSAQETEQVTTTKEKTQSFQLGVRFGDDFGIDAVIPFSHAGRLHPSVIINDAGVMIGSYLDWVWGVDQATGLKLVAGVGPELWFFNDFDIGVAGDLGVEYNFNFPLEIGFDWRPGFTIINYDFHTSNWGLTARWRF